MTQSGGRDQRCDKCDGISLTSRPSSFHLLPFHLLTRLVCSITIMPQVVDPTGEQPRAYTPKLRLRLNYAALGFTFA